MRRLIRIASIWVACSLLAIVGLVPVTQTAAAATQSGPPVVGTSLPGGRHTVTLITGDKITVDAQGTGTPVISIVPAPRTGVPATFEYHNTGGDLTVIPSDVADEVPIKLDPNLFDISMLIRDGYDDATTANLPMIVSYNGAQTPLPGLATTQSFGALNSAAATMSKAQAAHMSLAVPTSTVNKIWLDGKVKLDLSQSTAQIGAPAAWSAGLDGTGVTVAVLDTGIDTTHPDLAGKVIAAQDFSGSSTGTNDYFGHGTHVASTIAGTGAASGGVEKGVAFGANLINGKVLGDDGSGSFSQVMAGMQWAAATEHASIVSMSLGGGPSDGTDPVSELVNSLTQQYGTLFVIAAGNSGGPAFQVATPGAADSALTVAAVDSADTVAGFSSRGPRLGDYAIKPDISAPGVKILAARAAHANAEFPPDPTNPLYTTVSGTSMATPHVAGSAALLKEEHPTWSATQLKGALEDTAKTSSASVFDQGGGRVDVAHAITDTVYQISPDAGFGLIHFPWAAAAPMTDVVSFGSSASADTTFKLSYTLTDPAGNPAPAGMLTLGAPSLTIPAGGSAGVQVILNPRLDVSGQYSGYLTATQQGGTMLVHVPIGFTKEVESYNLTLNLIGRDGQPATSDIYLQDLTTNSTNVLQLLHVVGSTTLRIVKDSYSVTGFINDSANQTVTLVGNPQFSLTSDVTLTMDARKANPVALKTVSSQTLDSLVFQYTRFVSFGTGFFNQIYATWGIVVPQAASPHLYVQTMAVPAIGTMHFDTRWLLHDSSTDYDIFFNQDHGVSGPLAYTIDRTKLATVSYAINAQKPGLHMSFGLFPGYINGRYSWWLPKDVVPPLTKTMVVSPGPDSYQPLLRMIPSADPVWGGQADLRAPLEQFTAGQVANIPLLVGPGRPSADQLGVITGAVGADCVPIYGTVARIPATDDVTCKVIPGSDILVFTPTEFVDAMGNSALLYSPQALTNITIAQNGQQLAQGDNANGLGVQVPPEAAAYKIAMDTDLSAEPWVVEGIRTHTAWGFSSSPADTNKTIPLLTVDYIAPINMLNQLQSAGGTSYMRIKVGHSPTTGTPPGINPPTVKISTDDGATWTQVYASPRSGGEYRMDLDNLPSTGFLSVSVSMTDTSGATFDQQIIRAYALHQ